MLEAQESVYHTQTGSEGDQMCCQYPRCGEERRQGQWYNSVQWVRGLIEALLSITAGDVAHA